MFWKIYGYALRFQSGKTGLEPVQAFEANRYVLDLLVSS